MYLITIWISWLRIGFIYFIADILLAKERANKTGGVKSDTYLQCQFTILNLQLLLAKV